MIKRNFKLVVFVLTLVVCLSLSGIIYAQEDTYELTSQDKVILTEPSVCFIISYFWGYVLDPWDNTWSDAYYQAYTGTGFCVNPDTGHIVTAGHIVEISEADFKYDLIYAYLIDTYGAQLDGWTDADWNWAYENIKVEGYDGGPYDMEVFVQFNTANSGIPDNPNDIDTFIRAELIDFSGWEQRDIAILKIQPQTGRSLSSVMIGDSSMVEIQDQLTIIGYPWTSEMGQQNVLNPTITNGNISGKIMIGGTEVLQIQGDAREGNSGGPVLNDEGMVIGILTMGTDYTNNYLRPSNDVMEILNRNGVTNKLGNVDELFKEGLVMYRLKHYSKAIENFNSILNLNQRHIRAQEYRSKAQEAINRGEDVPYSEEQPVEVVETGEAEVAPLEEGTGEAVDTAEDTPAAIEEEGGAGKVALGLTIIILAIVLPIIFIALIIVIVILVVRRKRNVSAASAKAAGSVQSGTTAEPVTPVEPGKPAAAKEPADEVNHEEAAFCPSCGANIKKGQKFCGNCGNKLE